MRFSDHFIQDRRERSDRREISIEMCERAKAEPMSGTLQENGRTAYWGYIAEKYRYLKVIVESDGEEITTAHWDRRFKREMERRAKES
jgi:hypothetical protein